MEIAVKRLKSLRRGRLETTLTALQAIRDGEGRPTQILHRANLSWTMMVRSLKVLEQAELIESKMLDSRKRYEITRKGDEVLLSFEKIRRVIPEALQGEEPGPVALF